MQVIHLNEQQCAAIVQAMHAVATAEGTVALLPEERDSIIAIQRHLLHRQKAVEPAAQVLPADLAEVVDDPAMRRETVRILIMLPIIDRQVLMVKVGVVEKA